MRKDLAVWPTAELHLAKCAPDAPVLYFSPEALRAEARQFRSGFPGAVTYAVKANAHPAVIDNLVAAGLAGFDVASPAEMTLVRAADPDVALHYHNPVRSMAEIEAGIAHGVRSWSVDDPGELEKLDRVPRAGTEIAVRLHLPVPGAAYDFGEKFGADADMVATLLQRAVRMGFAPSVTFHPGTQCTDPEAWASYIAAAARAAETAGIRLARLNVGGGFAAHRDADRPDLGTVFARIETATRHAFGAEAPGLVCEPGRAMVADAFDLALRVKAIKRDGAVFLNDGIYGGLSEFRDIGPTARIEVLRAGRALRGPRLPRVVFGPTCDSLDRLPDLLPLPAALDAGDHLLIRGMGAYVQSIATTFNGYGLDEVVTVSGRGSGHGGQSL